MAGLGKAINESFGIMKRLFSLTHRKIKSTCIIRHVLLVDGDAIFGGSQRQPANAAK